MVELGVCQAALEVLEVLEGLVDTAVAKAEMEERLEAAAERTVVEVAKGESTSSIPHVRWHDRTSSAGFRRSVSRRSARSYRRTSGRSV